MIQMTAPRLVEDPIPSEVSVRTVSLEDRERLARMLSRISLRTIYERFHAPYPDVPGWALAGMLEADHDDRESLVAVSGDEIVGHAMYVRSQNGREAEFAVVVEAGSRDIDVFTGSVLGENRRTLGALVTVFPGMRYEVTDGAYQVRAPLRASPHEAAGERVA
jgi:hypothetical protein